MPRFLVLDSPDDDEKRKKKREREVEGANKEVWVLEGINVPTMFINF